MLVWLIRDSKLRFATVTSDTTRTSRWELEPWRSWSVDTQLQLRGISGSQLLLKITLFYGKYMQNHPNQNFAPNRTVSKANKCHKNILKLICSVGYHPIFQANLKHLSWKEFTDYCISIHEITQDSKVFKGTEAFVKCPKHNSTECDKKASTGEINSNMGFLRIDFSILTETFKT